MQGLEKILEEIESMPYNAEAIGCGLEDRCITDRYAAAAYGYNEAVKRIAEIIRCHNGGWIPVDERLPEGRTRWEKWKEHLRNLENIKERKRRR